MEIRTRKPEAGNKYYIRQVTGGWNGAVQGYPTDVCNVLANCVGYCNGRFNEIGGYNCCKYQFISNAENFIEHAIKDYGLQVVPYPVLGGIMVWQKGSTLSPKDGAGHVAIVEKLIDGNTIYTSESSYGGKAFYNATRKNTNGRWGLGNGYTFRGCIVNPVIGDVHYEEPKNSIYTLLTDMYLRKGAGTNFDNVKVGETTQAMRSALTSTDPNAKAVVKKGTNVTALEVIENENGTWLKNYSGYICIKNADGEYCKKID